MQKRMMGRILLATALLLSLLSVSEAQTETVSAGSGSGSGSGVEEAPGRNCSELRCSHGCNVTDSGAMCYCPIGYSLGMDMRTCEACPGGMYGIGCSSTCNCTSGNTCNRVNGTCECNSCYTGDRCEMAINDSMSGAPCYVQFLEIADKSVDNLRNFYGVAAYPTPPRGQLLNLVAREIMETNPMLIRDIEFDPVSRSEVGQGPLVKLSWRVDKSQNRQVADQALSALSDKIKLGNLRATYIAQDSGDGDSTLVTLNAGVKEDPV